MTHIYINPTTQQAINVTVKASDAVPNMLSVTAAVLSMKDPSGTVTSPAATIVSATTSSLTLSHQFVGGEVATPGLYLVKAICTVGGVQVPSTMDSFMAHDVWDNIAQYL